MPLGPEDVQALIATFERSDWTEMTLAVDGTRLELSRTGRPPAAAPDPVPSAAPIPAAAVGPSAPAPTGAASPPVPQPGSAPAPAPPAATSLGSASITAPSIGLFWRSPQPGAPPFVEIGQTVTPDDTVCIIEVMKLMTNVKAGVVGTVSSVEAESGAMVEHGQRLFGVEPIS